MGLCVTLWEGGGEKEQEKGALPSFSPPQRRRREDSCPWARKSPRGTIIWLQCRTPCEMRKKRELDFLFKQLANPSSLPLAAELLSSFPREPSSSSPSPPVRLEFRLGGLIRDCEEKGGTEGRVRKETFFGFPVFFSGSPPRPEVDGGKRMGG